jgi:hypothetical protein
MPSCADNCVPVFFRPTRAVTGPEAMSSPQDRDPVGALGGMGCPSHTACVPAVEQRGET